VEHRHLLPDEIDLLIDGEVGFGVAPLQAHVERCESCRTELEEARRVVATLERLPHFTPSPLFAERVMARVQVFEPWHVAALDTARQWVPRSATARALAASALGAVGLVLSVGTLWLAIRADLFLFFVNIAADRARGALVDALGSAITGAFGQPALEALRTTGAVGALVGITGFLLVLVVAAYGLRTMAGVARRRRA
jgi:hypothetical protein